MDATPAAAGSIGVDALFQYMGSGVQLFSGMVFYIIAARLFGTSGIGAIALFIAIVGLFNILFSFGLSSAAQHFTSYDLGRGDFPSVKKTILKILLLGTILSVAGLALLQAIAGEISLLFLHSYHYTHLVRFLGIVLFGNILFGILKGVLLGIQQFKLSAIINVVVWVTYFFGALLIALYLRSLITIVLGWILGISLGVVTEFVAVLSTVKKYHGFGRPPTNASILSYSVPILFSGIISYGAAYVDRFIVSGLMTLSSLGIYNFALMMGSALGFLVSPFNSILMPKFSEFYGKNDKFMIVTTAEVSSTLLSYFYVPAALGIAALAPEILILLGGVNYVGAAMPLRIIMFFTALFVTQNVIGQAIASTRRTKLFLYSSIFGLVGNVILSLILIPQFGLTGGAVAYSSVNVISFSFLYYFARKETIISYNVPGMVKVWFAALVMFIFVIFISDLLGGGTFMILFYIVTGAIIYIGLAKVIGIFRRNDKELLLSLFPPSLVRFRRLLMALVLH